MSIPLGAATLLAATSPAPQRTSEGMKSGPWGLAIILLLCVAVYFLWRSMNKHLRRAQQHFAADPQPASPAATDAERAARSEPRSDVRGGAPGPPSRTGTNTSPPPES